MTNTVNTGLDGAGRIGQVHTENLAHRIPGINLAPVVHSFLEAVDRWQDDDRAEPEA